MQNFIVIKDDKIYVYQSLFEMKIVNLRGEYISKKVEDYVSENPLRIRVADEKFYVLKGKTDRTIVRRMFQDMRQNIRVISGEVYEDNLNPNYENSIDIFDKKGKWLFSFKSKTISKNCFYHNGKIYKVLPFD